MTDDPKQIGNFCGKLVAPACLIVTWILWYFGIDHKSIRGILTFIVSISVTAFIFVFVLPFFLNTVNAGLIKRSRSQFVRANIVEFCKKLVEEENGLEVLRQTIPSTVSGQIARKQILNFISLKADFWMKSPKRN